MKGTWTNAARGIQCPLEGIGRVGCRGQRAAHIDEVPDVVDREAMARGECLGNVDVVIGIRVRRTSERRTDGRSHEKCDSEQDYRDHRHVAA